MLSQETIYWLDVQLKKWVPTEVFAGDSVLFATIGQYLVVPEEWPTHRHPIIVPFSTISIFLRYFIAIIRFLIRIVISITIISTGILIFYLSRLVD